MCKFSFIFLLLLSITACGQRGPLYLPQDAAQPQTNDASSETSAGESDGNEANPPQTNPQNEDQEQ
ncbi:LPS translocon maturation chaperone LptM [Planctobacterium marinum]|uniref:Lipoprotein n=1 Tax=Planctobacterium marinum TaxID=1631968 RepID=A0AA48HSB3_9ALTE|nr:hypothetical protein MACH26_04540 [Planctobacterium marinum]